MRYPYLWMCCVVSLTGSGCGQEDGDFATDVQQADTAAVTPQDGDFILVDAATDDFVEALGQDIDIGDVPSPYNVSYYASNSATECVELELSGRRSASRTERSAPYALFGDADGDFRDSPEPLAVGSYTLRAREYRAGCSSLLEDVSLSFSVTEDSSSPPPPPPPPPPSDSGFVLVNGNGSFEEPLVDGSTLDLPDDVPSQFSIRFVPEVSNVACVVLEASGALTNSRDERSAPYLLYGDSSPSNYNTVNRSQLSSGNLTLRARAYGSGCSGNLQSDSRITVRVNASSSGDPVFNSNDMIALHFDHNADEDDGHAAAAGRTTLQSEFSCNFIRDQVVVVGGTYGPKDPGRYQDAAEVVMDEAYNDCGGWLNAHDDRAQALREAADVWESFLRDGRRVWVQEGGQADFSAELVRRMRNRIPGLDTRDRITIVQHSARNEELSTQSDLEYCRNNTNYIKIPDANATLQVWGGDPVFESGALGHPTYGRVWRRAFDYLDPNLKIDFSDSAELFHFLEKDFTSIRDFADAYF
ncbi:MAG: hypothetical protein AAF735_04115 [Myxococcota bacterium]